MAATGFQPALRGQLIEQFHQRFILCGLGKMLVEAGLFGALAIKVVAPAGERDEEYLPSPRLLTYHPRRVVTIQFRHGQVEHRDVRADLRGDFNSFDTILSNMDFVTVLSQ